MDCSVCFTLITWGGKTPRLIHLAVDRFSQEGTVEPRKALHAQPQRLDAPHLHVLVELRFDVTGIRPVTSPSGITKDSISSNSTTLSKSIC
jgi:hypothetical protein